MDLPYRIAVDARALRPPLQLNGNTDTRPSYPLDENAPPLPKQQYGDTEQMVLHIDNIQTALPAEGEVLL
jgi:hypothetical protein